MHKNKPARLPVYFIIFTLILLEGSSIINCQPNFIRNQLFNNALENDTPSLPPRMEWNFSSGNSKYEEAYSEYQTSDNGYIFTGGTWKNSTNNEDVWLFKTDEKGNEIWNKTFHDQNGDVGHYVQQTNDNGYLIIGGNTGSGGCYDDILLIKTDSEGNKQWNKTFGGPYIDKGNYGQQTTDNGYIIVGSTYINVTHLDEQVWLIKTDENGTTQWNRTYGGNQSEYGTSIQQTNDNGYIILGFNNTQILLFKTDENGTVQWNKTYGQQGLHYEGYKVQQTSDMGYIIMGCVEKFTQLDEYVNVLLIKTNENGNISWEKILQINDFDWCFDGQQTIDGGFILCGYTWIEILVIKTDSNGNMIWNRTFGPNKGYGYANSISQTNDNGYILAGISCDFYHDHQSAFLIKLAPNKKSKSSFFAGTIKNLQVYNNYTIFYAKKILLLQLNPFRGDYLFKNEEIIVEKRKFGLLNDKFVLGVFKSNI